MKQSFREGNTGPEYYRYDWYNAGSWTSEENGIAPGTVRVIAGRPVKAWAVYKRRWPRKDSVLWIPVKPSELGIETNPPTT